MNMIANQPARDPIHWSDEARRVEFERWLASLDEHRVDAATLRAASADASFRRYFRIDAPAEQTSYIVMDAPPPHEDVRPFVRVAGLIAQAGLHAPLVVASDVERGLPAAFATWVRRRICRRSTMRWQTATSNTPTR